MSKKKKKDLRVSGKEAISFTLDSLIFLPLPSPYQQKPGVIGRISE
jgi:hypothetical protein